MKAAKLPVHGYEGKRATARPVEAQQLPPRGKGLLDASDCTFTPVTDGEPAPVRLHHRGICAGVFPTREAANAILGLPVRS